MGFKTKFSALRDAAYPLVWCETHEPDRLMRILLELDGAQVVSWDCDRGLVRWIRGEGDAGPAGAALDRECTDPRAALGWTVGKATQGTIVVLLNYHRFLSQRVDVVQAAHNAAWHCKEVGVVMLVAAPVVEIPAELERVAVVLPLELPDAPGLAAARAYVARGTEEQSGFRPKGADDPAVLDAARGLTAFEAEQAFALSVVERSGEISVEAIQEAKAEMVKRSGKLTVWRDARGFDDVGGQEAMKRFCLGAMSSKRTDIKPRGILVLGVSGTGKSLFAKALGRATKRIALRLDVGSVFGSYVGDSERSMRASLSVADAMAPDILMVDEIEKGFAGVGGAGAGDSGTAKRVFGTWLQWMQDRDSDVYVVATCNDISSLPPEFVRAERWDALFFVDLPRSIRERAPIWAIQRKAYGLGADAGPEPEAADWTGAEIASCCRIAAQQGMKLTEAAEYVVPIAVSAREQIDRLREWAAGRCIDAHRGGRYDPKSVAVAAESRGRRIKGQN